MPLPGTKSPLGSNRKAPRIVIGIDPSASATGILELDVDSQDCRWICIESKYRGPQRLEEIYKKTAYFLARCVALPLHICMEDYAFNPLTSSQSHKLGEIGGVIKLAVWKELGMWPTLATNNQAKKFALGKGGGKVKITKSMLLKAVLTKWQFDTDDDNVADAYIQARIARAIVLQKTDLLYEQEVLDAIMTPTKKGNIYIHRFMTEAPAAERDIVITSLLYGSSGAAATH